MFKQNLSNGRFEMQVVQVQKVRNQQAGTLAEKEGTAAIRHPKCSGLARALTALTGPAH